MHSRTCLHPLVCNTPQAQAHAVHRVEIQREFIVRTRQGLRPTNTPFLQF